MVGERVEGIENGCGEMEGDDVKVDICKSSMVLVVWRQTGMEGWAKVETLDGG
jgi:hypothetical protein